MTYRWGLIIVMLIAAMTVGTDRVLAAPTTVEMKKFAEVSGPKIEMGELINVKGPDAELVKRIQSIELGAVPWPGSLLTISRAGIRTRLRQHQVDISQIEFRGARETVVTTKSVKIKGSDIVTAARDYILGNMPWDRKEVIIETSRFPKDRVIPEGVEKELHFQVTSLSRNSFLGPIQLSVGLYVDKQLYVSIPLSLTVRVFKEVVIANRTVSRKEILTRKVLSLKRSDITYLPRNILTDISAVEGKVAERFIPANTVLTGSMIGVPLAVKRGNIVTLLLADDLISIVTKGKAMENGRVGEVIRVKNLDSRKDVYGKVVDSQTIRVSF